MDMLRCKHASCVRQDVIPQEVPQGIDQLDRKALAGLVENAPYELKKWHLDEDVHVRTIADGVALIAYKVSEELVVDGKLKKLEAFDSSV